MITTPSDGRDEIEGIDSETSVLNPHGEAHPWRLAAIFIAPLMILCALWVISNPPGAAPDESDHLVKAIGTAGFSLGTPGELAPTTAPLGVQRNASITRVFSIPADLDPTGYSCFAFDPNITASCLPANKSTATGNVQVGTPMGAYPPFLYLPVGLMARLASTPAQAFLLARLTCALLSLLILFLGAAHLSKWLGRRALIGFVVALSPMAIFAMSVVSTSGFEISAGCTVAAVVVAAILRPDSALSSETHWVLACAGGVLALSRQLGVVALAFLLTILLISMGWKRIRQLISHPPASFIVTAVALAFTSIAALLWEVNYDSPILVGSYVNKSAIQPFVDDFPSLVNSSVGVFGWMDTPLPDSIRTIWIVLWTVMLGAALIFGTRREAIFVTVGLVVTVGLAGIVFSRIFFPIGSGLQGRQFLAIFALCPILSAVIVDRVTSKIGDRAGSRLFGIVAVAAFFVQTVAIYWNGRRYATGVSTSIWFPPHAQWSPPLGWPFILIASVLTCLIWALIIYRCRPRRRFDGELLLERSVGSGVDGKISGSHTADL